MIEIFNKSTLSVDAKVYNYNLQNISLISKTLCLYIVFRLSTNIYAFNNKNLLLIKAIFNCKTLVIIIIIMV